MNKDEALAILLEAVNDPEFIKRQRERLHLEALAEEERIEQEWLEGSWRSWHL